MRPINVGFPSGKITLVLYSGTEDEKKSTIYGIKTDRPYVRINGQHDYLTDEEVYLLRRLMGFTGEKQNNFSY